MPARTLIALLVLLFLGDDPVDEGRRGNALYEEGDYEAAAAAYRAALEDAEDETGALYTGLWNNLGAALHRQEAYEEAATAFERAIETAETSAHRARALYNAGNNAEAQGQPESALAFYREALLANPDHEDARFNYEYLKREMDERPEHHQPSPPNDDIEPSDYARELKRRAEALAQNQQYDEAYRLMQEGLQRDSTVAAFQTFITRLSDVAQIDSIYP